MREMQMNREYTQEEVKELLQVFEAQRLVEVKLESFCRHVAQALDYPIINRVGIFDDEVFIDAEWQGPYQSHDNETFYFPATMLTEGEEKVIDYLKRLRKEKQDEQRAQKEQQRRQEELQLLRTLKEKYKEDASV